MNHEFYLPACFRNLISFPALDALEENQPVIESVRHLSISGKSFSTKYLIRIPPLSILILLSACSELITVYPILVI